jgi:hypothetical protein
MEHDSELLDVLRGKCKRIGNKKELDPYLSALPKKYIRKPIDRSIKLIVHIHNFTKKKDLIVDSKPEIKSHEQTKEEFEAKLK